MVAADRSKDAVTIRTLASVPLPRPRPQEVPDMTDPNDPRLSAVACECRYYQQAPQAHDCWHTTLQHPTPTALLALMGYTDLTADTVIEMEHLAWYDLPGFVAAHSWDSPMAVDGLARRLSDSVQHRLALGGTSSDSENGDRVYLLTGAGAQ